MASRKKSARRVSKPRPAAKKKRARPAPPKKKKAAKKRRAAAKPQRDPLAPRAVTTGPGSSPAEIGASLVEMFNRNLLREIEEMWWSPKITSIEGTGQAWDGRAAVDGKNNWWAQTNRMVSGSAEGPYVGATGFAVKFHIETEDKTTGQRTVMDEVGVYTVRDGRIVQEEFMYGPAVS